MSRIIILAGEPAVGKSTITKAVIARCIEAGAARAHVRELGLHGLLLRGSPRSSIERPLDLIILGKYEDGDAFPGTDRLGMNVAPQAVAYIEALRSERSPRALMFEGDRLLTRDVLRVSGKQGHERRVYRITTSPDVLAARRDDRARRVGAKQTPSWVQGRATKVTNLLASIPHTELRNDTPDDQRAIVERLISEAQP